MSAEVITPRPTVPTDVLELQAAEQRRKLGESVHELRGQVQEKLDMRRQARQYFGPASAVVAGLGLLVGFGIAGMFSRRR